MICGKPDILNISHHYAVVHKLDKEQRKSILKNTKYQTVCVYENPISSGILKRNVEKTIRTPVTNNACRNLKVIKAPKKLVKNSSDKWKSYSYPDFWFKHPFSLMIVGPTSCGKTFFVRQILESQKMLGFYFECYYNQPQRAL